MQLPPVVLALDLATTTGFCVGRLGGKPRWGAWDLQGGSYGDRYRRLADHMADQVKLQERLGEKITEVWIEAPLARQQKTENVARVLMGLVAVADYVASRFALQLREAHVGTVRAAMLGQGRFGKGTDAKAEIDRLCQLQGWDIPENNARDAFLVWKYAEQLKLRGRTAGSTAVALPMRRGTPALPGI